MLYMPSRTYVFLFIIIIHISDIVTAFWGYRNKSRSRPRLFCQWNLNNMDAHNFIKMSLLQAYIGRNRFDIIRLSETYLDNSYYTDDDHLTFPGYNLIRADNPNNIKRGGVCIYYRGSLPVKVINLNFLSECLVANFIFLAIASV